MQVTADNDIEDQSFVELHREIEHRPAWVGRSLFAFWLAVPAWSFLRRRSGAQAQPPPARPPAGAGGSALPPTGTAGPLRPAAMEAAASAGPVPARLCRAPSIPPRRPHSRPRKGAAGWAPWQRRGLALSPGPAPGPGRAARAAPGKRGRGGAGPHRGLPPSLPPPRAGGAGQRSAGEGERHGRGGEGKAAHHV